MRKKIVPDYLQMPVSKRRGQIVIVEIFQILKLVYLVVQRIAEKWAMPPT